MWMRFQVITSTLPVSIFVNLMERDIVTVKSAFEVRLDPGPLQITALAFTVYLEPVNLAEGETKKGSSHSVWTKKAQFHLPAVLYGNSRHRVLNRGLQRNCVYLIMKHTSCMLSQSVSIFTWIEISCSVQL